MAEHVPVLCSEVVRWLEPERGGLYVDCTVGLGGHAAALLERSPEATLVGIDRDSRALALASRRLARFGERVRLVRGRFDELAERLAGLEISTVDGVLADLGVSSMQLEDAERGFSFQLDGPLDMRMGNGELTARDVINRYGEEELAKVIKDYGEERQARRIAREIVRVRRETPFERTAELRRVIERAKPRAPRGRRGRRRPIHPATQVFQALRIEVNRELGQLEALLDQSVELLAHGGRMVLISYHSLEDRMVKHTLRDLATAEVEPITGRPRAETRVIEVLTKKPVRPSAEEVAANPRARSARLRAARRL